MRTKTSTKTSKRKAWMLIGLSLLGGISQSSFAQADPKEFRLQFDPSEVSSLSTDQHARLQSFLSEVEAKLSGPIKESLAPGALIRFSDIESDWPRRCQWNLAMGVRLGASHETRQGGVIEIERSFLREILLGDAGSSRQGCGYANGYRFSMATLIREIGRLVDQKTELSKDPRIQTILGSAEIGGILPSRRIGEDVSLRSPDISEFETPQEGFVVNFERYAMDPEFACRRPTLSQIFSERLKWDPWPQRSCQVNSVVPLSQEEISDSLIRFVNLDPRRLYQVHYLFASKGEEAMSRWGHAMYRLVFCAPSRKEPGPECLQDISYHVVVSFRANVEGTSISPIKGMEGDYPSQLYLLSLLEVMREYNADGLRDLVSVPLTLTREQGVEFLMRALEMFWEYRGKYQFLSNNCATEALNLLKSVYPDPAFQKNVHVISPIGLYSTLKDYGLMNDRMLDDRKRAQAQSYFFPSEKERLERAFQMILKTSPSPEWTELEPYLRDSTASQRLNWFSRILSGLELSGPDRERRVALASEFFILESYLVRSHESEFYKEIAHALQDSDAMSRIDPDGSLLKIVQRAGFLQESLSPQKLAPSGYGIALPTDYKPTLEADAAVARTEFIRLMKTLGETLQSRYPERYQELIRTNENRKKFAQFMKG